MLDNITRLRLRLWWRFFWPPWETPRWKVVLRFQQSVNWQGYWAYVNHIETGEKRMIGPVAMHSMEEAIKIARAQAHDILSEQEAPICNICAPFRPDIYGEEGDKIAKPARLQCRHCGKWVRDPKANPQDAYRWQQPPDPHAKEIRLQGQELATVECHCGWVSKPVKIAELQKAHFEHAAHAPHRFQTPPAAPGTVYTPDRPCLACGEPDYAAVHRVTAGVKP